MKFTPIFSIMETKYEMIENFLTIKPRSAGQISTFFLVLLLVIGTQFYLHNLIEAKSWMPASAQKVLVDREWWRPWTTLLAHGDLGHIASNLFLFIPFAYFLTSTFGFIFFPVFGFFIGGLINLLVLQSMPQHTWLIGVSGVVYWMGASWITLSFLIDLREKLSRRIIKSTAITAILFVPESFRIEVSYLSHFLGTISGFFSGLIFYYLNRQTIRSADRYAIIAEPDDGFQMAEHQQEE